MSYDTIELEFGFTREDLEEYVQCVGGGSRGMLLLPCKGKGKWRRRFPLAILLALVALVCFALFMLTHTVLFGIAAAMAIAYSLFSPFLREPLLDWHAERADKYDPTAQSSFRMKITDKRISVKEGRTRATLPWTNVRRYFEVPNLFILLITPRETPFAIGVLVPKRAFATDQQMDDFRTRLHAKCKTFSGFPLD